MKLYRVDQDTTDYYHSSEVCVTFLSRKKAAKFIEERVKAAYRDHFSVIEVITGEVEDPEARYLAPYKSTRVRKLERLLQEAKESDSKPKGES